MNQLTIRGFDQVLSDFIHNESKKKGISLNQVAIKLLKKGAGLSDSHKKKHCVGSTLDEFIGSWSDNEAKEFENDVAQLRQIDDEIWK